MLPGTLQSQLLVGDKVNVSIKRGTEHHQPLLAGVQRVVGPWEQGQDIPSSLRVYFGRWSFLQAFVWWLQPLQASCVPIAPGIGGMGI